MANFIEEFYYGNLDPQARSTKQNKTVQKQMEVLMLNEDFLTEHLSGESKKKFLDFCNAWGVFYAIYWRRPFGFSLIFCAIVGFIYYVIFTDKATKDKMSKILIVNGCFIALVFLIALSLNLMFNPRHAGLLNGGAVMW